VIDVGCIKCWYTAEVKCSDEEVEEYELLEPSQRTEESWKLVLLGQQVEVAEQHSGYEQCSVEAVYHVQEVEGQSHLAHEASIACASGKSGECGVDDNGSFELNRN